MNLKTVLTIAALYLGVLGLGFMFVPRQVGIDAVPSDASPALIAYLRIFGGPMLESQCWTGWLEMQSRPGHAGQSSLPTWLGLPVYPRWIYGACSVGRHDLWPSCFSSSI
jgi:hypothetical protein